MLVVVKEREGPGFALRTVPVPVPPPGWVRVRVRAAGICGSDLPIFDGRRRVPLPLIPGHEVTGEVERLGPGVDGWTPGDRVAVGMVVACGRCTACAAAQPELCDALVELGIDAPGGFADYMVAPAANLHRLPAGLSFVEATAADPLASTLHGLAPAQITPDDVVAVFGLGAIGLYAVQVARSAGARRVVALGRRDDALQLARELGAEAVDLRGRDAPAAVRALAPGGASVVVEATGAPAVASQAVASAAKGARVVVLGVFYEPVPMDLGALVRRELRVFGRLCYTWDEYEQALALLASGRIRPLVSHTFPLSEISRALDLLRSRGTIKVVVEPAPQEEG
ncbi:MAG: alcohol dehydrogenase catalytic domain-containing protein [Armatimonadota bacterium]|nr:alcohol dehydrogenase catalytic domain-containing protein [Armatimonadota bacterium]MDR7533265.1 alcohol dehydrogenase catalytic domain-containing protein [Armatimonadota bacterium]MDR7536942.1 alcohol dehydrogenase catalytic domain-containing protein [Armatimonadota bacterium]